MAEPASRTEWTKKLWRSAPLALLALTLAGPLFAWGQHGHRITAEVAQRHLNDAARAAVETILEGEHLAQAATWPDEIKSYPSWRCASPYHYVTVPLGADYPHRGVAEGDAVQALVYFTDLLRAGETSAADRRIALSFIAHFVGDLHQPLHSGRGCDRGGNDLEVNWFGELEKLHAVWDTHMIESENLSFTEFADFIDHVAPHEVSILQLATPVDWIRESQDHLDAVYTCFTDRDRCPCFCGDCRASGTSSFGGCRSRECDLLIGGPAELSWAYKAVHLPVVRDRLATGGVRLAGLLNWIFDERLEEPERFAKMASEVRRLEHYDAEAMDACRGEPTVLKKAAPEAS